MARWLLAVGCPVSVWSRNPEKLAPFLERGAHTAAAPEACALVLRIGIDAEVAYEDLMGGWAASAMLVIQLAKACAGEFDGHGAFIGGLLGVQRLLAAFTAEARVDSALLPAEREVFQASVAEGRGGRGLSAIVSHYIQESAWAKQ
jgi:3-hydroxyisobutyrate dehydrogenase-like beta-hydroxyacid dehydrogenase